MVYQPSMDDQFLARIQSCIEDNLENERFSVEELARDAGLSRSMLHRKLIRLTGKSASDFITEKRLLRAKELLENDAATVSEIAYKVGFGSPSYFTKVFKDHFHISPGEMRKGVLPKQPSERKSIHKLIRAALIALIFLIAAGLIYNFIRRDKQVEKSIAILPFDNLSSDTENQYFADGIVEDLLDRLSKIAGLKVISRTSSEVFRNKGNKTVPEIANLLKVNYILEGTVQRETDKVRINVQLIDAKNDNHILSKQYEKIVSEVFSLQSEIAAQIASELSFVLTEKQKIAISQSKTKNLKAFEYYQMGRFHSSKRWIDGYTKGIEYYEKAVAEDPKYGLAYAGLADNYHLMALQGWINKKEGREKATGLALKALDLDPSLAGPHTVLGSFYIYIDWDWDKGEQEYVKALKLDPNYSTAHQYYSEIMFMFGMEDKAREHINRALELDPFSFVIRHYSALYYYNQGEFDKALAENKICLDLVKDHSWALDLSFDLYLHKGNDSAAFRIIKNLAGLPDYLTANEMDSIYREEGIYGITRWEINNYKWVREYDKAIFYAMLGEDDKTLDMLELAVNAHELDPMGLCRFEYNNLHSHPRFKAIRKKMRLPPL